MASEYVQDLEYTEHFFAEQGPYPINYIAALNGIAPRSLSKGFTYCELGCGKGLTANILAAANPEGRFYAVDFNRDHVVHAQQVAERGQIRNVTFLQKDFAKLLEEDLPPFDFITLHGVYSWIVPEMRRVIVEFLDKKLLPGGLVYISYNTFPGWAPLLPIREIMLSLAEGRGVKDSLHRVRDGVTYLKFLRDKGAGYFTTNPVASAVAEQLLKTDARYIAHEYLNAAWHPMYFHQVATELHEGGLEFIGSASVLSNYDAFVVPPAFAELLASAPDRVAFETHKAFVHDERFRRDIFVKTPVDVADAAQRQRFLQEMRFTSLPPRSALPNAVKLPSGELRFDSAPIYPPLMDALCNDAYSTAELAALPGLSNFDQAMITEGINMLAVSEDILPARAGSGRQTPMSGSISVPHPMNRALLGELLLELSRPVLVSPVLGSGVPLDLGTALCLHALLEGPRETAEERIYATMSGTNRVLRHEGKEVATDEEKRAAARAFIEEFTDERLEYLRRLGIVA